MAKETRALLVKDATAKVAAARSALAEAEQRFKDADSDAARAEAQAALNAATAELERYSKVLEALQKGKAPKTGEDDAPTLRTFICAGTIRHNGVEYGEGEEIELTKPEYEALPKGAVFE